MDIKKLKQQLMIAIILSVMFGLGWGIGLPATQMLYTTVVRDTFSILFILLTAFQGLFIFILHCVRSTEVVNQWKKWLSYVTGGRSENITSLILDKVHHPQSNTTRPTQSTTLSEEKATLQMASKQQQVTSTSSCVEFSLKLSDDNEGMNTLKQNIAKSGIVSGSSTLQCNLKSVPEAIAEKEKSTELAEVESLQKENATTALKLPVHLSDGLEIADQLSLDGDQGHSLEKSSSAMPLSNSKSSLQSKTSETGHCFNNPIFVGKDDKTCL